MSKEIYIPKFPGSTGSTGVLPGFKAGGPGAGGGGAGFTLPHEINWNDGVSPTYADENYTNAAPGHGFPLSRSPMSTIATPAAIAGYTPATDGYNYVLKHGPDTGGSNYVRKITDITLPGSVDPLDGFRIMAVAGKEIATAWFFFGIGLYNTTEGGAPKDGFRFVSRPRIGWWDLWAYHYTGGTGTDFLGGQYSYNSAMTNEEGYHGHGFEFPAGGTGTSSFRLVKLGTGASTRTYTKAMDIDVSGWSPLTKLHIWTQPRYDLGWFYWPWIWVGSLTDAWPV